MGKCFSCKPVFSHNKLADSYFGEILSIEKIDVGNHKHRSFNYTIKEKKPIEQQEVDNIREISLLQLHCSIIKMIVMENQICSCYHPLSH